VKKQKEKAQEKCQQNQHSHLASVAVEAVPTASAFTTITGSSSIIPLAQPANTSLPLQQCIASEETTSNPQKHPAAQPFTGATFSTPLIYEGYQYA
jgi:hypothetical protein